MTNPEGGDRARRLEEAIRLRKEGTGPRPPEIPPRLAGEPALLGDPQRSLWLVHQLDPLSPAYNLARAFRVRGGLDPARLRHAADSLVSRHRILRSTFRGEGDRVVQVVHPPAPVPLPTLVAADGEGPAAAARAAREPFDLERGPLVRLGLVEERPGGERLLLIVLHHILADERSLGVLWKDLAAAYDGRPDGAEPPLQYDDYVHWARHRDRPERDEALDYWRRRLDPLPDDLRLPFERKAAEAAAPRGRLMSRAFPRSVPAAVRRLAAATGNTPFAVLAFAFRLLLQRYTDGQRVAFGTPVSARSHPSTADMVGYFLNPVVVSSRIDEDRPVEDALSDFGRELRRDLAHAVLPFDRLAEALSPPRQRDRHPLFQVMFVLQEEVPPPTLGDARLEPVPLDLGESKFDLTLFVTLGRDGGETAVEYRADRFEETWMSRLLGHYEALLGGLSESLSRAVAEVRATDEHERRRLDAFARGAALNSAAASLPERILERARLSPGTEAISCDGKRHGYGEIVRAGLAIAGALARAGVRPGDRVGLFVERSASMVAGILGCHWAGAAYVPLDPAYPEARNRLVLEDADVAAVLTSAASRGRLPAVAAPTIPVEEAGSREATPGDPAAAAPDSPAYILYTSGSTGRPKGVVVTHANLAASTAARLAFYDAPPGRFLLVPSVAFDSSVAGIFWTLATGGALVVPTDAEARDAHRLAQKVAEEKVTSLLCVPSLYAEMLRSGPERMRGLETAIVAGESCPSRLVEEHFRLLPHARLFNEYGPTEATVWATVHEASRDDASRPVSIGRPIPGVRVDLVDGRGRPVPAGVSGHAIVSGPTVARGYWRRPDLTAERFEQGTGPEGAPELRYRTGDRMEWTEDGRLLFLGREDEQVKLRGFRIEPAEIEAALLECSGVEEAAVVARSPGGASPGPEALVAFVRAGGGGVAAGWRRLLATRLPDHMIPARLVPLEELPRLPNGKVDRGRLRDLPLAAEAGAGPGDRVPSGREQALLSLWEGLLGRSGIGPHDNFFELGGHSLLAVEMARAIERDLEAPVSAADVFENPTVHGLLRRIDERGGPRAAPYRHLFPIQPHGRGTPLVFAVPHFFTAMLAARFRGERPVYGLRGVSLRAEGNRGRWPTLRHLGEELVEEIARRFPGEACLLAGYSFGASMAVEAARILEERGRPARRLYLVAPMAEDFLRLGPFRLQLDALRQPVGELTTAEALGRWLRSNDPRTRRPYQRAFRFLAIQPWRRLVCLAGKMRQLAGLPLTPAILHADIRVERFRLHAGYRPGVLRTPTVVFNPREPGTDAAATWWPFFSGPFEVVPIPDPHEGGGSVEEARRIILDHLKDLGSGEGA
jgi:amino acid adenylation domain-containing protein